MTGGYIVHSALLKERNWTEKLIKTYLEVPCKVKPNPHRKSVLMRLYSLTKVEEAEAQEDFKAYILEKCIARKKISDSNLKRAHRQREEILLAIKSLHIEIPMMCELELIERACRHYNDLWSSRGNIDKQASVSDSRDFLNRIAVNYLRHNETTYDKELERIFGKVGVSLAYQLLKSTILEKISECYPFLETECTIQKSNI